MDDADRDQRQPLSSDQFREWASVPSPVSASSSLDHVEAPALTGSSSFSPSVPSDLTQQTLNDWNSDNSSARRRGRTTSVSSIEDADSSRPRKRVHLENSPKLANSGREPLHFRPRNSFAGQNTHVYPSKLPDRSQTYLPDHQPQGHNQTTPYPTAPTVASSSVHGLTMQSLERSSGSQSTSYTSSSSSLPTSHEIPSAHTFSNIRTSTLREAEPTAATSDCDPSTALLRSHSSVSETTRHANTTLGTSTLMARFGIPNPQALSQLPHSEAIKILNQIYINLQNHAPGSVEYPHALRLLQDCCSHASALPTHLKIENVAIRRIKLLNRGGEAVLYKGEMGGRNIVIREAIPVREWESARGRELIQVPISLLDLPGRSCWKLLEDSDN